ncbi:glycosyl hydrolase family 28-related protein [Priestia megaterium]|uniref:glycosyl hydrolase family 28-related protein n=1 Tax=Priestia megaterium TaxID=1404 RepID=UPI0031FD3648
MYTRGILKNQLYLFFIIFLLSVISITLYVQGSSDQKQNISMQRNWDYNVFDFGSKGEGKIPENLYIQKAIDVASHSGGGTVYVPPGHYIIKKSITIRKNVTLMLSKGAVISVNSNVNGINLKKDASLVGGTIKFNIKSPTKSLIYIEGTEPIGPSYHLTNVKDISLESNGGGIGIHLFTDSTDEYINWVHFSNINISYLDYGIKIETIAPKNGSNWITGNTFNQIGFTGFKYGIFIKGNQKNNQVGGNTFTNIQMQPTKLSKRFIYNEGSYNHFSGVFWDWQESDEIYSIEFTNTAQYNRLDTIRPRREVLDEGLDNLYISPFNKN